MVREEEKEEGPNPPTDPPTSSSSLYTTPPPRGGERRTIFGRPIFSAASLPPSSAPGLPSHFSSFSLLTQSLPEGKKKTCCDDGAPNSGSPLSPPLPQSDAASLRYSLSPLFLLAFAYLYDRLPPPPTHSVPAYTSRGSSSSVDICLRIQADFFGSLSGGPFPSPPSSPSLLPPLWQPHRRWERSLRQTPLDDSSRRGSLYHHPWGKRGRI